MAKLNAKERRALPSKDFALPNRRYPIENEGHAKAALARGKHNATPEENATIKRKVAARFPDMSVHGLERKQPFNA